MAGKKTVQVYMQKAYGDYNKQNNVEAASVELAGFAKTDLIPAGETRTVSVEVSQRQFASYDATSAKTYVLTGGDYYLAVADNAHDAVNNILAKKGYTPAKTDNRMDAEGNADIVSDAIKLEENTTKFAKSAATGNDITNQFEFADWNYYENRGSTVVEYVSRSDWQGTMPSDVNDNVVLPWSSQLQSDINALGNQGETKLPADNGEYPTYGSTETSYKLIELRADAEGNLIPYDDEKWEALLDQLTWDEQVDLVRYGMRTTAAIQSIDKPDTLDHNGPSGLTEDYYKGDGLANENKDPLRQSKPMCYPAGGILAATCNLELMYKVGDMIGEDALWAGYNGLYGPGSNIHRTPYSGRNFEYYSEDGFLSGMICGYECSGMEANGLYVYNKHVGLNDQEDQFLRGECGMTGIAVTDMWSGDASPYMNLPAMLAAGTNLIDGQRPASDMNASKTNHADVAWGMRESVHRILYTVVHSNAMNGVSVGSSMITVTPWWQIVLVVVNVLFAAGLAAGVAWIAADEVLIRRKKDARK